MALINCPECKKEVSDTVKRCPHCGFVMRRVKWNWWMIGSYAISILAIIFVLVEVNKVVSTTTETFIGIVTSLIGAAATIIVGAQIYNSIEAKRLMNDIRDRQNRLDTNLEEAYKSIGTIDTKIGIVNSRIAEFDKKMEAADSKFNDLYSFAAFIQGFIMKEERPMEAYINFIDALCWGLGAEHRSAVPSSFNFMDEIVEELERMFVKKAVIDKWDFQIDKMSVSLNALQKHPKYQEFKQRFEVIEKRRVEIVEKINDYQSKNNKGKK